MSGRSLTLPHGNYIEYMSRRLSFKGAHNRRKLAVLWILLDRGRLTAQEVYNLVGFDCSYSCIRSTLSRLVKYQYISRVKDNRYSLLVKGTRFIYAAQQINPQVYNMVLYIVRGHQERQAARSGNR